MYCCVIISRCTIFLILIFFFFFFNDTATTEIYTLSLHDALPISFGQIETRGPLAAGIELAQECRDGRLDDSARSEEHTSELQSPCNLVCRLLLEKKKHAPLDDPCHVPADVCRATPRVRSLRCARA